MEDMEKLDKEKIICRDGGWKERGGMYGIGKLKQEDLEEEKRYERRRAQMHKNEIRKKQE